MKQRQDPRIVFLDLETEGLDPSKHHILEIGIVLVSRRLRDVPAGRFSHTVSLAGPNAIDPEVEKMHRENSLLADCCLHGLPVSTVEELTLDFLLTHAFEGDEKILIGGYSPSFDLGFLRVHMPRLAAWCSHRTFDVSTIRDLASRIAGADEAKAWREQLHKPFPDARIHRALPDCDAAIREVREYAKHFCTDSIDAACASAAEHAA